MRWLWVVLLLSSCKGGTSDPPAMGDGGTTPGHDASSGSGEKKTGEPCTSGDECKGGICLGSAGGPEESNPRFTGGYCTTLGCVADTQDGCGADEICVDGGFDTYCVNQCSKAAGLECHREGYVCLGLGTWGGCFSMDAVDCDAFTHEGCGPNEECVKVGFEDHHLGRCQPICDPMLQDCTPDNACYYIRSYNVAFCGDPGIQQPEDICTCDKCCVPTFACTPDLDGAGKHCKPYCLVSNGCSGGGECVPLETGSPFGGCVAPGSAGT